MTDNVLRLDTLSTKSVAKLKQKKVNTEAEKVETWEKQELKLNMKVSQLSSLHQRLREQ